MARPRLPILQRTNQKPYRNTASHDAGDNDVQRAAESLGISLARGQAIRYQQCGGGRRVIRKKIGGGD